MLPRGLDPLACIAALIPDPSRCKGCGRCAPACSCSLVPLLCEGRQNRAPAWCTDAVLMWCAPTAGTFRRSAAEATKFFGLHVGIPWSVWPGYNNYSEVERGIIFSYVEHPGHFKVQLIDNPSWTSVTLGWEHVGQYGVASGRQLFNGVQLELETPSVHLALHPCPAAQIPPKFTWDMRRGQFLDVRGNPVLLDVARSLAREVLSCVGVRRVDMRLLCVCDCVTPQLNPVFQSLRKEGWWGVKSGILDKTPV